jgi:acyl-CoA dehydrogenase
VADVELGGLTAAAKAQAGVVLKECADCAVLLFGGNGYTRSGQGEIDVLFDLMVRQLAKNFQRKTAELERSNGARL